MATLCIWLMDVLFTQSDMHLQDVLTPRWNDAHCTRRVAIAIKALACALVVVLVYVYEHLKAIIVQDPWAKI